MYTQYRGLAFIFAPGSDISLRPTTPKGTKLFFFFFFVAAAAYLVERLVVSETVYGPLLLSV